MNKQYRILSIDAWAGCGEGSWDWNAWYDVGVFDGNIGNVINEE